MKKTTNKRGLTLLHDVITRRIGDTMKAQRAGRMSLLGTTSEPMPIEFADQIYRRQNPIKIIGKIPSSKYQPPLPAYNQSDYPNKYVAKTLNYLADIGKVSNLVYCIDKRMQNSIKIKYQIVFGDDQKPKYALISIYE